MFRCFLNHARFNAYRAYVQSYPYISLGQKVLCSELLPTICCLLPACPLNTHLG